MYINLYLYICTYTYIYTCIPQDTGLPSTIKVSASFTASPPSASPKCNRAVSGV